MKIIALLALGVFVSVTNAQHGTITPVTDISEVMKEHAGIAEINLWPGFNVKEISVAVHDSVNTWLSFS
jgi:hypothetical protein